MTLAKFREGKLMICVKNVIFDLLMWARRAPIVINGAQPQKTTGARVKCVAKRKYKVPRLKCQL
jgi:hypothetical protein